MALDDDRTITLIGFLIVLAVGINIIFFFGDTFGLGSNVFTGFATAPIGCVDIDSGISCGSKFFASSSSGCPAGSSAECTNPCELERAINGDNRVCPSACTSVCVTSDVAAALGK